MANHVCGVGSRDGGDWDGDGGVAAGYANAGGVFGGE